MAKDKKTGSTIITEAQAKARTARELRISEQLDLRSANIAARATRTPQQQLDALDKRLGIGVGAIKERVRLNQEILCAEASSTAEVTPQSAE